ncbi:hypothetical protein [Cohnella terricola]|uniref:Lipoprotein n=1 Tax=Cohnella terricola TaxID=1289167 RepID=A0A559JL71_9BACL|nr:hypothetical protein [Cohnella terricola]TVY00621.1 hypothetical protein FPZ45_11455 [Cohnella terricola]
MRKMIFPFIIAFVFLTACGVDPVKDDLLNYLNHNLQPLGDEETRLTKAYSDVTGENYSSDEETYEAFVNDIVPGYQKFVFKLEEIRPETQEVRDLHEIYILGANTQLSAMTQMQLAFENDDANLIPAANDKLAEGRKYIRDFQNRLDEVAKKHNVKITKK